MFLCLLHITTMPKMYTSYQLLLYISLFVARQHYIPHPDHQLVFIFCMYIIINFKMTRVKTWVKISKVMPHPKSVPREREGSLTAKGPNLSFTIWYSLTVHIIRF